MDIKTRNIPTPAADAPTTPSASARAPVVGRFAPSPSGRMHLGNVFSCLCAWLSARSQGGSIVLRIEDLDDRCKRPELATQLIDDLTWLGLEWDEGPYYQHDRLDLYEGALRQLQDASLTCPPIMEDRSTGRSLYLRQLRRWMSASMVSMSPPDVGFDASFLPAEQKP